MDRSDLEKLRAEIDEVDGKIVYLVKTRADLARRVAKVKDSLGMEETDNQREMEQEKWLEGQVKNEVVLGCLKDVFGRLRKMSKEIRKG